MQDVKAVKDQLESELNAARIEGRLEAERLAQFAVAVAAAFQPDGSGIVIRFSQSACGINRCWNDVADRGKIRPVKQVDSFHQEFHACGAVGFEAKRFGDAHVKAAEVRPDAGIASDVKQSVVECACVSIGIGAGVYDRCKVLGMPVFQVISSNRSAKPLEYFNVRSQLWGEMKNWLMVGACIPYMPELRSQLVGMTYGYNSKMQLSLTTKKDLKKLGLSSPDIADAVALTFGKEAYEHVRGVNRSRPRQVVKSRFLYV